MVVVLSGATCSKNVKPVQVEIDPSLLQRCPNLPVVPQEQLTMGGLYTEYSKLQQQYIECAIRHDCLIEVVDGKNVVICPKKD